MIRWPLLVAAAGLAAVAHGAPAPAPAPVPPDVAALFPEAPGRATMLRICSQCHSPAIPAQQRLSPDGWQGIVDQMAGLGAPGTDAELAEIVTYLAQSFPAPAK